jgi:hypothetical protein
MFELSMNIFYIIQYIEGKTRFTRFCAAIRHYFEVDYMLNLRSAVVTCPSADWLALYVRSPARLQNPEIRHFKL